jgi:hypothetical protein
MTEITPTYKYNCDKCKFHINSPSKWNIHCATELHKTGKRKKVVRTPNPKTLESKKCTHCAFISKSYGNTMILNHVLVTHSTPAERKEKFPYYCEHCDFGGFSKTPMDVHNNSKSHKLVLETVKKYTT